MVRSGTHFYLGTGWVPVARELSLEPGEQVGLVGMFTRWLHALGSAEEVFLAVMTQQQAITRGVRGGLHPTFIMQPTFLFSCTQGNHNESRPPRCYTSIDRRDCLQLA